VENHVQNGAITFKSGLLVCYARTNLACRAAQRRGEHFAAKIFCGTYRRLTGGCQCVGGAGTIPANL